MKIRFFCIFALMLTLSSCFKDEEYDTKLILRPVMQYVSGEDAVSFSGCVAYAFSADTTGWEILSWSDAVAGVMTNRSDPSKKRYPTSIASTYTESGVDGEGMLAMQVEGENVFIVVASESDEVYAYRIYTVGLNLSKTYLYAFFRWWKTTDYTENSWEYFVPTN